MKNYMPLFVFLFLGIIWGSNFIYMKMANHYINASQVVFIRVLFGFIPVFIYAFMFKKMKLSHLKYSFHFFMMSLLGTTLYYYSFVRGTALLDSGIAGILSGSIPIFAFLLSFVFLKDEKASKVKLIGILLGFLGVFIIAKPFNQTLHVNFDGLFFMILGSLIVGSSFVYAKKFIVPLKIHFSALCAYQLGFGTLSLSLVVNFNAMEKILEDTHTFLGAVIGLGVLGTGLAFILYYYIIEKLGAIRASSSTYLPPLVALFIGYFFIDENIVFTDLIATFLIFLGVFLINKKDKKI